MINNRYLIVISIFFSIEYQIFDILWAIKLQKHFVVNIRSFTFALAIKICWLWSRR